MTTLTASSCWHTYIYIYLYMLTYGCYTDISYVSSQPGLGLGKRLSSHQINRQLHTVMVWEEWFQLSDGITRLQLQWACLSPKRSQRRKFLNSWELELEKSHQATRLEVLAQQHKGARRAEGSQTLSTAPAASLLLWGLSNLCSWLKLPCVAMLEIQNPALW